MLPGIWYEMVALLMASPAAGRVLQPICRMLGIETSVLRPEVVVPVRVVVERVRKVRMKVAVAKPWRIPLPRGVLSAARRAGYGKIPRSCSGEICGVIVPICL